MNLFNVILTFPVIAQNSGMFIRLLHDMPCDRSKRDISRNI